MSLYSDNRTIRLMQQSIKQNIKSMCLYGSPECSMGTPWEEALLLMGA